MQRLTFRHGLICEVVWYLCFFYLNKVIFAVLEMTLQKCQTSMEVFCINKNSIVG